MSCGVTTLPKCNKRPREDPQEELERLRSALRISERTVESLQLRLEDPEEESREREMEIAQHRDGCD